jgi:phosphonate transport system permease protein
MKKRFLRIKRKNLLLGLIIILIYYWALKGTNSNPIVLAKGIPHMIDFISRMFPPDFTNFNLFFEKTIETIQMAIIGSTFGALLALPLSFLAARNVTPNKTIYHIVRSIFDILRGINEIVWGLIFVAMVGLGPFPGVLALTAHVTGALGRYFSEAIETVNPDIIKAIVSTGASKTQVIIKGIIPEVKPLFLNYSLYYFENNFRAATVLGLVGAGGIGMELITSIRLFRNQEVLTILMIMVFTVMLIDRFSAYIRKKVIQDISLEGGNY